MCRGFEEQGPSASASGPLSVGDQSPLKSDPPVLLTRLYPGGGRSNHRYYLAVVHSRSLSRWPQSAKSAGPRPPRDQLSGNLCPSRRSARPFCDGFVSLLVVIRKLALGAPQERIPCCPVVALAHASEKQSAVIAVLPFGFGRGFHRRHLLDRLKSLTITSPYKSKVAQVRRFVCEICHQTQIGSMHGQGCDLVPQRAWLVAWWGG